jgi:hypothetical protein
MDSESYPNLFAETLDLTSDSIGPEGQPTRKITRKDPTAGQRFRPKIPIALI